MAKKKAAKKKAKKKASVKKKPVKKEAAERPIIVPKKGLTQKQAYAIAAFILVVVAGLVWYAYTAQLEQAPVADPVLSGVPIVPDTALATLTVINDESCSVCSMNNVPDVMQMVFSEIDVREIESSTEEAQLLIASLGVKALPAYVFSAGIADTENFTVSQQAMRKSGDYYVMDERAIPDIPVRYLESQPTIGEPMLGSELAAVVIVEYSNPACGACRLFTTETKPMLLDAYGDSILFVYKSLPLNDLVLNATIAGDCANDQGLFWEFNDIMYDRGALAADQLLAIAEEVGLDAEEYANCTAGQKHLDEVMGDQAEAMDYAVVATPTLFINGIKLTGIPGDDTLKEIIDAELAE